MEEKGKEKFATSLFSKGLVVLFLKWQKYVHAKDKDNFYGNMSIAGVASLLG